MATIRSFIVLPAPEDVKARLAEIQQKLRETAADVRWESPEKLHITLKFLGDAEEQRLGSLSSALTDALQGVKAFPLVYTGLGTFPEDSAPRIVWAGTEPSAEVDALFRTLETVCGSFGFLRETRKFHPHITIGRVKGTRNLARLTEATKSVTFEPISTECREIRLMKSVLGPEGSAYSILTTVSLLS